jgi:hypothetical protein
MLMTNTSEVFPKIVSKLMTKDACVALIHKLHHLKDSGYLKDSSHVVTEFLELSASYDNLIAVGFNIDSPVSAVVTYIADLIDYLEHLDYVEVTLAFHPGKDFLQRLYAWFQNQFSFAFYLQVLVDDSIGGGLLLSYKGVYTDLSLKKAVADYFNSNKDYVSSRI